MQQKYSANLEAALAQTEADAEQTLKAVETFSKATKRLRLASKTGDLRELQTSLDAADKALVALRQQFGNTKEGWSFDETRYFEEGEFAKELQEAAKKIGLSISEREERLYCYPLLIRVSGANVLIDRKRERKVRPSYLVNRLKELQRKPAKFRSEAFLQSLFTAYSKVVATQHRLALDDGPVIPLVDIYELLTLLPGQSRDYTKQEFVRDVYLLNKSGTDMTRLGSRVTYPISRGAPGKILTIVDQSGEEKSYYGIRFSKKG